MNAPVLTRESWLAERMTGIGASDAAAVLGQSPWKSPFQLWAEKTGNVEPDDLSGNEAVEFGIRLEPTVAQAFADRTGRHVEMWPQYEIVRDPERPWMTCTPDAIQHDDERGEGTVQIKTTSAFNASDWVDEWPLHYQIQCQYELAVTGHAWGTLVVLIGGQKLRYFDFERNDKFITAMLPRIESFWRMVESRTPPEVDGSLATAKILAKLHPDDSGETVMLPQDAMGWTEQLLIAKQQIKDAEAVATNFENQLKAALGDATYGLLADGSRWSWKSQTRKEHIVKESTFRVLRKVK